MIKRKFKPAVIAVTLFSIFLLFQQPALFSQEPEQNEDRAPIEHPLLLAKINLYDGRTLLEAKDKIGLTPAQVEKIEALTLEYESFSIRSSAEIKIKELLFAAYMQSKKQNVDRKEMERYVREISKIKTDMVVRYMQLLLDLREILTPKQLWDCKKII